jgi:hypothetical protein
MKEINSSNPQVSADCLVRDASASMQGRTDPAQDVQGTDPFGYGRCPVCGEWLVPADNLLWCRCPDPIPIQ